MKNPKQKSKKTKHKSKTHQNKNKHEYTHRWGVFLMTRIPGSASPSGEQASLGALQAACPFHRKSKSTLCKKTASIKQSAGQTAAEASDAALAALKDWCLQAPMFTRRRWHVVDDVWFDGPAPSMGVWFFKFLRRLQRQVPC